MEKDIYVKSVINYQPKNIKMKFPCRKSKVQEYDCQVFTKPRWKSSHKVIGFDKCLTNELFYLWDMGIVTTGSCCGNHFGENGSHSYIGVVKENIQQTKDLGYKVRFNPCRSKDEDSFIPKTNFI